MACVAAPFSGKIRIEGEERMNPVKDQDFTVVAYDIPDDRRRKRVANILEDYGERVQYSVFECELTKEQRATMERLIADEIDESEDGVRLYAICERCVKRISILGQGQLWSEEDVLIL